MAKKRHSAEQIIYGKCAYSGFNMYWGIGSAVWGRNDLGAPRGINTGTVDGAVQWTPQGERVLGYATYGNVNNYPLCRQLEPPRPGRSGRGGWASNRSGTMAHRCDG